MRIGSIGRSRANILQDVSAEGDEAPDYTWIPYASSVPVSIESTSGTETYRGRQLEASVSYVVRMRYNSGVLPTMRVVPTSGPFANLTLDIKYVQQMPYGRGRTPETVLFCADVPAV